MSPEEHKELLKAITRLSRSVIFFGLIAVVFMVIIISLLFDNVNVSTTSTKTAVVSTVAGSSKPAGDVKTNPPKLVWKVPDVTTIPVGKAGDMIRYGKDLLAHTSKYFGPNGMVARLSNGMNCQNCHLDGGGRIFANNYSVFMATYPKMSFRSGKMAPATARIKDCFERSLAGTAPDTTGREVKAILAYMVWIGKDVKKGQKLFGTSTEKLPYLDRAADPERGKDIYTLKCQSCHGKNGEGIFTADKKDYVYPPLWGDHSYNDGAGMYRLSNLAGFVKNNMPFGATYKSPQLSAEQAWDVAAFVNSQPRPHRDQRKDWPDLKSKPIDFPFGPYNDNFSEKLHKFGPYKPIVSAQKSVS